MAMIDCIDNQTWVALGFALRDLRKTGDSLSREEVHADDVLYHAVTTFNALTGGKMLFKANMTPQRKGIIVELLRCIYALVESSDDAWVRVTLRRTAERMAWENEQVSAT